jgi:hypothetical protein
MEDVATDSAVDAMCSPTMSTAPMTTTTPITGDMAMPKSKAKVKKELTAAEREVQNQKRQGHRIVGSARNTEALAAIAEVEKQERLVLLHAKANAQEASKMRETDAVGTTSSSSVTSQAQRLLILPHSLATLGAAPVPLLHVHVSFGSAGRDRHCQRSHCCRAAS